MYEDNKVGIRFICQFSFGVREFFTEDLNNHCLYVAIASLLNKKTLKMVPMDLSNGEIYF